MRSLLRRTAVLAPRLAVRGKSSFAGAAGTLEEDAVLPKGARAILPESSAEELYEQQLNEDEGDYSEWSDLEAEARVVEDVAGVRTLQTGEKAVLGSAGRIRRRVSDRVPQVDGEGRAFAPGFRKTAKATVWLKPGSGDVLVNGLPAVEYFPRWQHRTELLKPFTAAWRTAGQWDVFARVQGGGKSGQAEAVRHGIAHALVRYNPDFLPALNRANLLRRDPRVVERKKPGFLKARKQPQWHKR